MGASHSTVENVHAVMHLRGNCILCVWLPFCCFAISFLDLLTPHSWQGVYVVALIPGSQEPGNSLCCSPPPHHHTHTHHIYSPPSLPCWLEVKLSAQKTITTWLSYPVSVPCTQQQLLPVQFQSVHSSPVRSRFRKGHVGGELALSNHEKLSLCILIYKIAKFHFR